MPPDDRYSILRTPSFVEPRNPTVAGRPPLNHALLQADFDFGQRLLRYFSRLNLTHYNLWTVLIELLLIGAVVYTVLRFLRGTRGARLAQAVLMILAISFLLVQIVAREFKLDRIILLYPYFLAGVFLVSLVAFQMELRRMLIRIGETRLFRRWTVDEHGVIDPIIAAVRKCSARRIGVLLAIERSTELGAVVETGVELDARISSELLQTIFWPGSALHDLGVIIRRNRIIAAGCQFPLSESETVERTLGSRHRAAIGVSEEADAVVVVVSEETGTISVVNHGHMTRDYTPDELRSVLIRMLSETRSPETTPAPAPDVSAAPEPPADVQTYDGTDQAPDDDLDSDAGHLDRRRPVAHR